MMKKLLALGVAVMLLVTPSFAEEITGTGHNQGDLQTYFENVRDLVNRLKARDEGTANSLVVVPTMSALTDNDSLVEISAFTFVIDGVTYLRTASAMTPNASAGTILADTYGSYAFDIGSDLVITATGGMANETGYGTSALAAASLVDVAADQVRIGYITIASTSNAYIAGTSDLSDTAITWATGSSVVTEDDLTLTIP